jgi:hypothetical protein
MPNKFFARVIATLALGATHRVKKWGNRDQTRCETFCTGRVVAARLCFIKVRVLLPHDFGLSLRCTCGRL